MQKALESLEEDPFRSPSDPPSVWEDVWDASNHRRMRLADGWRLSYTISYDEEGQTFVLVLFIGNHREYDRLYGFRSAS